MNIKLLHNFNIKRNIVILFIFLTFFNFYPFISLDNKVYANEDKGLSKGEAIGGLVIFVGINYLVDDNDFSFSDLNPFVSSKDAQKRIEEKAESKYEEIGASEENVHWLARLIHAEARGEKFEGQIAVGNVVLNRVLDNEFPETIYSVIYQQGQFCVVDDGQINLEPNKTAYKAAKQAFKKDITNNSLYFYNPLTSSASGIEWMSTRKMEKEIGNHRFRR